MKQLLKIFLLLLIQTCFAFGQAKIKYDFTTFDFGQITEGTLVIKKDFRFTNIGDQPLIITNATTSDGGSMASYPKELILPGQSGAITFHYDGKRIGKFDKTISVQSNGSNSTDVLHAQGEVIYKRTEVLALKKEIDIGDLLFDAIDTIQFVVLNIGKEKLHYRFDSYNYPEGDLLWSRDESSDSIRFREYPATFEEMAYSPNERVQVTIALKNIYGNVGKFKHNFCFLYNSHDTLVLSVKGNYIGKPRSKKIISGDSRWRTVVYYYEQDKLIKLEDYNGKGKLTAEDFYEGSNCVYRKMYNGSSGALLREHFYKESILVDKKVYGNGY